MAIKCNCGDDVVDIAPFKCHPCEDKTPEKAVCAVPVCQSCSCPTIAERVNLANELVELLKGCLCNDKSAYFSLDKFCNVVFVDPTGFKSTLDRCETSCHVCPPLSAAGISSSTEQILRMISGWIKTGVPRPANCTPLFGLTSCFSCPSDCLTDADVAEEFVRIGLEIGFLYSS